MAANAIPGTGGSLPHLTVEDARSPGERLRLYYRMSDGRHESHDGLRGNGIWTFPPPDRAAPRVRGTLVVLDAADQPTQVSRPIDLGYSRQLSDSAAGFRRVSPGAARVASTLDRHPGPAIVGYYAGALVLLAAGTYSFVRGVTDHGVLRLALALILGGLAMLLLREGNSLRRLRGRHQDPTLMRAAGGAFLRHPAASWGVMLGLCTLTGALLVHFTRLNGIQIWVVAIAAVAFLIGAIVGTDRWLRLLK